MYSLPQRSPKGIGYIAYVLKNQHTPLHEKILSRHWIFNKDIGNLTHDVNEEMDRDFLGSIGSTPFAGLFWLPDCDKVIGNHPPRHVLRKQMAIPSLVP